MDTQNNEGKIPKCELSNSELIAKCKEWVSKLCKSGGSAWTLRVPVDFNTDPDILFNELANRLEATTPSTGERTAEDVEFLEYVKESRDLFCNEILSTPWNPKLRTICDELLICFDQMRERLVATAPSK